MCKNVLYELCGHVKMKPCPQDCGRVDKTHEITREFGWCSRKDCKVDQKQAEVMARQDAKNKAEEAKRHGVLHAQVSGAQKAGERGATTHTKLELTSRLAIVILLRPQRRQGAAPAEPVTRRARKAQHRKLQPQIDQSPHAMRAETAEDGTQKHDQAKPEAQKSTPLFHEVSGKQDQQQHDHRWLQYSPASNGALYHQALAGVDGRYIY